MGFLGDLWNSILYIPIINTMVGVYQFLPFENFGVTIILFTLLTRVILWPLSRKNRAYREAMQQIQPELEKLKKKHAKDKEKLYAETMKLYTKYKVNPASGCLPLLIQLPFTFALYQALREGLNPERIETLNNLLYSFIPKVTFFNTNFLWFDLTKTDPFYILPVLVAGLQYLQVKMSMGNLSEEAAKASKQTMIYMPLIFLFISLSLPSGLTLYILLTTISGIVENKGLRAILGGKSKEQSNQLEV